MKTIFFAMYVCTLLGSTASADPAFDQLWFKGSTAEAFSEAKAQNKPILLYWGAVWCPPCNELKAQVFTHPDFAALTSSVIRVYQDGDQENAQNWSDRLKVSGYPTVLLLSSQGDELLRVVESVSWEEFAETFSLALKEGGSFAGALAQALSGGEVPPSVWKLLAYSRWTHPFMKDEEKALLLLDREKLIELIPASFAKEKALLVAGLVEDVASEDKAYHPSVVGLWQRTVTLAPSYLHTVLNNEESIWAARDLVTYQAKTILEWAQKHFEKKERDSLFLRWIRAAEFVRTRGQASVDLQLWAVYPQLVITRLIATDKALPKALKTAVRTAVARAEREATTEFQRHSVMSGAAWLLGDIGDFENARSLLLKEIRTTDTPWYYQSSLAQLEQKQGNHKDALIWSHLARESAKGNSTRLQWIEADLARTIELASDNPHAIHKIVREYYDLAFSLPEGFLGRNASRAARVKEALGKLKDPLLQETFKFYAQRCALSEGPLKERCEKFFQ
ncbi:MAG: thioredoxin family protein [Deltaproteobacteria bacterium]|nr:thioredoxin family protein [Deltaproteobacteria bacterium]